MERGLSLVAPDFQGGPILPAAEQVQKFLKSRENPNLEKSSFRFPFACIDSHFDTLLFLPAFLELANPNRKNTAKPYSGDLYW